MLRERHRRFDRPAGSSDDRSDSLGGGCHTGSEGRYGGKAGGVDNDFDLHGTFCTCRVMHGVMERGGIRKEADLFGQSGVQVRAMQESNGGI